MVPTQKETMLLNDLKSQEQLCIDKYSKYEAQACDGQLKQLFSTICQSERQHLDSVNQLLAGTVPQAGGQGKQQPTAGKGSYAGNDPGKQLDSFLCQDALVGEKHVSSTYNISVFEFKDAGARNVLNHIQKEEQEHGKLLYDYMSANNMYS